MKYYKPHEFSDALYKGIKPQELLAPYSKIRLRKKRSRKKFNKKPHKYVGKKIARRYFAACMVLPIRRHLNYESIGRKMFQIAELPMPANGFY